MATRTRVSIHPIGESGRTLAAVGHGHLVSTRVVVTHPRVAESIPAAAVHVFSAAHAAGGGGFSREGGGDASFRVALADEDHLELHDISRALLADGALMLELGSPSACAPDDFLDLDSADRAKTDPPSQLSAARVLEAAARLINSDGAGQQVPSLPAVTSGSGDDARRDEDVLTAGGHLSNRYEATLLLDGDPDDGDAPIGLFCRLFGMSCPKHR
jgi:hypothetical protein